MVQILIHNFLFPFEKQKFIIGPIKIKLIELNPYEINKTNSDELFTIKLNIRGAFYLHQKSNYEY
jgi:hypothetical protein